MDTKFPTIPAAPVTQVFGNYNPSLYGGDGTHKGIDYGIMPNNPIYACMDGTIHTATTSQTGYGRHVRIAHPDGSMSIYGHLNSISVQVNDYVRAGQMIGRSGGDPNDAIDGDGLSTGAHLHWEIRPPDMWSSDRHAVDPMAWCLRYVRATVRVAEVTAWNGLNIRTAPSASAPRASYIALKRKEAINIVEERDGWARINSLRPEWVSSAWIAYTGQVIEIIPPDEKPPPELSDGEKLDRLWKSHPELW